MARNNSQKGEQASVLLWENYYVSDFCEVGPMLRHEVGWQILQVRSSQLQHLLSINNEVRSWLKRFSAHLVELFGIGRLLP